MTATAAPRPMRVRRDETRRTLTAGPSAATQRTRTRIAADHCSHAVAAVARVLEDLSSVLCAGDHPPIASAVSARPSSWKAPVSSHAAPSRRRRRRRVAGTSCVIATAMTLPTAAPTDRCADHGEPGDGCGEVGSRPHPERNASQGIGTRRCRPDAEASDVGVGSGGALISGSREEFTEGRRPRYHAGACHA